jgi:hypothetical protein
MFNEGVNYDGPFINLIMTHIFSEEEMANSTATGKMAKNKIQRQKICLVKKDFIKGKYILHKLSNLKKINLYA